MAVLLLAGAVTFMRSFAAFTAWKPGFEREHLALFSLSPPAASYELAAKLAALWDRVEGQLGAIPGVTAVGTASAGPLFGGRETWEMELQGRSPRGEGVGALVRREPGILPRARRRARAGDARSTRTTWTARPLVCLVNETLARRYWPGLDPDRQDHRVPGRQGARDVHGRGRRRRRSVARAGRAATEPEMYWSNRQKPRPYTWVVVRTTVSPARSRPRFAPA